MPNRALLLLIATTAARRDPENKTCRTVDAQCLKTTTVTHLPCRNGHFRARCELRGPKTRIFWLQMAETAYPIPSGSPLF
eukprot:9632047-Lingulodinium_polyedra.AAC.1